MALYEQLLKIAQRKIFNCGIRIYVCIYDQIGVLASICWSKSKDLDGKGKKWSKRLDVQRQVNGNEYVYFLLWMQNSGVYLDIPINIYEQHSEIFLTSNLTGCFIGLTRVGNSAIRICHYNFKDISCCKSDFLLYDFWIAPQGKEYLFTNNNVLFYNCTSSWNASFFGLRDRNNNKWVFTLQDYTDTNYNNLRVRTVNWNY